MNTPSTMTKIGAATQVLHGIGAPVNQRTVGAMLGWFNAEGGNWGNTAAYNPLNTTLNAPGARSINGVGVKAYGNWGEGISATVQTLKQANMSGIVNAFRSGDPQNVIHAISSSPWGTSAGLVAQTISSALGQHYSLPSAGGVASRMAQTTPGLSTPSVTSTGPTSSVDTSQALTDALLQSSASPIDTSGRVTVRNPLGAAAHAIDSGAYTTNTPAQTTVTKGSAPNLSQGTDRVKVSPGKGDINPLGAGWAIGRTDQGVDANAKVGTPIRALNDSRVVRIAPSWYAGQPLVLMQITSGPNTGRYWYVAEQISQNLHVGQLLTKGSVVATYAPRGTGIEIGWGSPKTGGATLAQATTGYTEGQQTPAGQNFRATELR